MVRNAQPRQSHVTFHKRAADAGPDRLREVLGIIALKGPRPSDKFLDEDDDREESSVSENEGASDRA